MFELKLPVLVIEGIKIRVSRYRHVSEYFLSNTWEHISLRSIRWYILTRKEIVLSKGT
jgi:hypothetical protein